MRWRQARSAGRAPPPLRRRIVVGRALTATLWLLVAAAVVSGPMAWVRADRLRAALPDPTDDLVVAVAAGVGAINLQAGRPVVLASFEPLGDGYWAVRATDGGALYGVGVAVVDGVARPVGGVARLPIPPGEAPPPLVAELGEVDPTIDDPVVSAVRSWAEGWLTGDDVSRFASPSMAAGDVGRPYAAASVTHLGGRLAAGGEAMLVRVLVDVSGPDEQLDMSLIVVDRGDGAWEVSEMLAAPPVSPAKRKPNDKKGETS